jgi:hypothetical protein
MRRGEGSASGYGTRVPAAWDADFSFGYLRELLARASDRFEVRPVSTALDSRGERPVLVLRHDIDVSLERALPMARLEAELGLRASYLFLLDSPLYDLRSSGGRELVQEIAACGHDIGLHFDPHAAPDKTVGRAALEAELAKARDRLEEETGLIIRSLSFHRPPPAFLRGPLVLSNMVNAYAAPLMRRYLSDSAGRFRAGDPFESVLKARGPLVQVLLHPIWWGQSHAGPVARLSELVAEAEERGDGEALAGTIAAVLPAVPFR